MSSEDSATSVAHPTSIPVSSTLPWRIAREHCYCKLGPFRSAVTMATFPTTVLFPDRIGRKREVDQGPEEGAGHRWASIGVGGAVYIGGGKLCFLKGFRSSTDCTQMHDCRTKQLASCSLLPVLCKQFYFASLTLCTSTPFSPHLPPPPLLVPLIKPPRNYPVRRREVRMRMWM